MCLPRCSFYTGTGFLGTAPISFEINASGTTKCYTTALVMIDVETISSLRTWFEQYTASFLCGESRNDAGIRLKRHHTARVCDEISALGRTLPLDEAQSRLAQVVALLHDVGRFEQYALHKTFLDSRSEDHAALGVRVLLQQRILEPFDPVDRELVLFAVAHHNKISIEGSSSKMGRLLAELVRDADKLDIWETAIRFFSGHPGEWRQCIELGVPDRPDISDDVYAAVMAGTLPPMGRVRTTGDFRIVQMGWVYDLNIVRSFQLVQQRGYLKSLKDTMPPSSKLEDVFLVTTNWAERHSVGLG